MQVHFKSNIDLTQVRVGVVHWLQADGLSKQLSQGLEFLGCQVITFLSTERVPDDLDMIFVFGPYGSMVPLARQLLRCEPSNRPALVFMMSEQLPNPELPEWFRKLGGQLRSLAERWAYREAASGNWEVRPWLRWLTTKGHRYRYYGDLFWLNGQGILSVLVMSSLWTAEFLRQQGIEAIVFPISFQPDKWANLVLERDIPVLWLGKIGTPRRGRLLERVRAELKARGVDLMVIDGVEHPYVFGEERTLLLSRTKVVLNLLREKWDDNSMRYSLAMPRRALVVTEPTLPHTAFAPGVHLIEAPIEELAETICYYLSHDEERHQIVERAYKEITSHSRVGDLITLIERAWSLRPKQVSSQINHNH